MRGRWLRLAKAVLTPVTIVAALAGCAGPQALVADDSVHITSPAPLVAVSPPFVVQWTSVRREHRSYALFVDRIPIPPGHTVLDLATDECKRRTGCVDTQYLAQRGTFVTDNTEVTVPSLRLLGGLAGVKRHRVHTLTVVLMDAGGHRDGEASWQGEFRD